VSTTIIFFFSVSPPSFSSVTWLVVVFELDRSGNRLLELEGLGIKIDLSPINPLEQDADRFPGVMPLFRRYLVPMQFTLLLLAENHLRFVVLCVSRTNTRLDYFQANFD